jgi:N6-adenosine-specific RNA methylase IME4
MSQRVQPDNLPWLELPNERFACISIDFPWHFESRAPTKNPECLRLPSRHYPTADIAHGMTLDLRSAAARDSLLFMWVTGPVLVAGQHIPLMKAWGFRPSSLVFWWLKTKRKFTLSDLERTPLFEEDCHVSHGYTSRQNVECVVLGRRGSASRLSAAIRQVMLQPETIISPLREHSRKPDEFYSRVEAYCDGPRLDMFGGRHRPGWTHWGHQHREIDRPAA